MALAHYRSALVKYLSSGKSHERLRSLDRYGYRSCKGGWKAVAMIAFNRDDLGCCKLLHSTWKNDEKLRHVVLQEVGLSKDLLQTKPSSARRMKKAPRLYGSSAAKSREEDAQAAIKEFLISGDYSANVAALDSDNLPSVRTSIWKTLAKQCYGSHKLENRVNMYETWIVYKDVIMSWCQGAEQEVNSTALSLNELPCNTSSQPSPATFLYEQQIATNRNPASTEAKRVTKKYRQMVIRDFLLQGDYASNLAMLDSADIVQAGTVWESLAQQCFGSSNLCFCKRMYNTWRLHRVRIIDACQQRSLSPNHQEKSVGVDDCPVNILSPMDYESQRHRAPAVSRENRRKPAESMRNNLKDAHRIIKQFLLTGDFASNLEELDSSSKLLDEDTIYEALTRKVWGTLACRSYGDYSFQHRSFMYEAWKAHREEIIESCLLEQQQNNNIQVNQQLNESASTPLDTELSSASVSALPSDLSLAATGAKHITPYSDKGSSTAVTSEGPALAATETTYRSPSADSGKDSDVEQEIYNNEDPQAVLKEYLSSGDFSSNMEVLDSSDPLVAETIWNSLSFQCFGQQTANGRQKLFDAWNQYREQIVQSVTLPQTLCTVIEEAAMTTVTSEGEHPLVAAQPPAVLAQPLEQPVINSQQRECQNTVRSSLLSYTDGCQPESGEDHVYQLSARLLSFQRAGLFCDMAIIARDRTLYAHSCVMAALSDKFASTFTQNPFADPRRNIVDMSLCDADVIDDLIVFVYTGWLCSDRLADLQEVCECLGIKIPTGCSNMMFRERGDDDPSSRLASENSQSVSSREIKRRCNAVSTVTVTASSISADIGTGAVFPSVTLKNCAKFKLDCPQMMDEEPSDKESSKAVDGFRAAAGCKSWEGETPSGPSVNVLDLPTSYEGEYQSISLPVSNSNEFLASITWDSEVQPGLAAKDISCLENTVQSLSHSVRDRNGLQSALDYYPAVASTFDQEHSTSVFIDRCVNDISLFQLPTQAEAASNAVKTTALNQPSYQTDVGKKLIYGSASGTSACCTVTQVGERVTDEKMASLLHVTSNVVGVMQPTATSLPLIISAAGTKEFQSNVSRSFSDVGFQLSAVPADEERMGLQTSLGPYALNTVDMESTVDCCRNSLCGLTDLGDELDRIPPVNCRTADHKTADFLQALPFKKAIPNSSNTVSEFVTNVEAAHVLIVEEKSGAGMQAPSALIDGDQLNEVRGVHDQIGAVAKFANCVSALSFGSGIDTISKSDLHNREEVFIADSGIVIGSNHLLDIAMIVDRAAASGEWPRTELLASVDMTDDIRTQTSFTTDSDDSMNKEKELQDVLAQLTGIVDNYEFMDVSMTSDGALETARQSGVEVAASIGDNDQLATAYSISGSDSVEETVLQAAVTDSANMVDSRQFADLIVDIASATEQQPYTDAVNTVHAALSNRGKSVTAATAVDDDASQEERELQAVLSSLTCVVANSELSDVDETVERVFVAEGHLDNEVPLPSLINSSGVTVARQTDVNSISADRTLQVVFDGATVTVDNSQFADEGSIIDRASETGNHTLLSVTSNGCGLTTTDSLDIENFASDDKECGTEFASSPGVNMLNPPNETALAIDLAAAVGTDSRVAEEGSIVDRASETGNHTLLSVTSNGCGLTTTDSLDIENFASDDKECGTESASSPGVNMLNPPNETALAIDLAAEVGMDSQVADEGSIIDRASETGNHTLLSVTSNGCGLTTTDSLDIENFASDDKECGTESASSPGVNMLNPPNETALAVDLAAAVGTDSQVADEGSIIDRASETGNHTLLSVTSNGCGLTTTDSLDIENFASDDKECGTESASSPGVNMLNPPNETALAIDLAAEVGMDSQVADEGSIIDRASETGNHTLLSVTSNGCGLTTTDSLDIENFASDDKECGTEFASSPGVNMLNPPNETALAIDLAAAVGTDSRVAEEGSIVDRASETGNHTLLSVTSNGCGLTTTDSLDIENFASDDKECGTESASSPGVNMLNPPNETALAIDLAAEVGMDSQVAEEGSIIDRASETGNHTLLSVTSNGCGLTTTDSLDIENFASDDKECGTESASSPGVNMLNPPNETALAIDLAAEVGMDSQVAEEGSIVDRASETGNHTLLSITSNGCGLTTTDSLDIENFASDDKECGTEFASSPGVNMLNPPNETALAIDLAAAVGMDSQVAEEGSIVDRASETGNHTLLSVTSNGCGLTTTDSLDIENFASDDKECGTESASSPGVNMLNPPNETVLATDLAAEVGMESQNGKMSVTCSSDTQGDRTHHDSSNATEIVYELPIQTSTVVLADVTQCSVSNVDTTADRVPIAEQQTPAVEMMSSELTAISRDIDDNGNDAKIGLKTDLLAELDSSSVNVENSIMNENTDVSYKGTESQSQSPLKMSVSESKSEKLSNQKHGTRSDKSTADCLTCTACGKQYKYVSCFRTHLLKHIISTELVSVSDQRNTCDNPTERIVDGHAVQSGGNASESPNEMATVDDAGSKNQNKQESTSAASGQLNELFGCEKDTAQHFEESRHEFTSLAEIPPPTLSVSSSIPPINSAAETFPFSDTCESVAVSTSLSVPCSASVASKLPSSASERFLCATALTDVTSHSEIALLPPATALKSSSTKRHGKSAPFAVFSCETSDVAKRSTRSSWRAKDVEAIEPLSHTHALRRWRRDRMLQLAASEADPSHTTISQPEAALAEVLKPVLPRSETVSLDSSTTSHELDPLKAVGNSSLAHSARHFRSSHLPIHAEIASGAASLQAVTSKTNEPVSSVSRGRMQKQTASIAILDETSSHREAKAVPVTPSAPRTKALKRRRVSDVSKPAVCCSETLQCTILEPTVCRIKVLKRKEAERKTSESIAPLVDSVQVATADCGPSRVDVRAVQLVRHTKKAKQSRKRTVVQSSVSMSKTSRYSSSLPSVSHDKLSFAAALPSDELHAKAPRLKPSPVVLSSNLSTPSKSPLQSASNSTSSPQVRKPLVSTLLTARKNKVNSVAVRSAAKQRLHWNSISGTELCNGGRNFAYGPDSSRTASFRSSSQFVFQSKVVRRPMRRTVSSVQDSSATGPSQFMTSADLWNTSPRPSVVDDADATKFGISSSRHAAGYSGKTKYSAPRAEVTHRASTVESQSGIASEAIAQRAEAVIPSASQWKAAKARRQTTTHADIGQGVSVALQASRRQLPLQPAQKSSLPVAEADKLTTSHRESVLSPLVSPASAGRRAQRQTQPWRNDELRVIISADDIRRARVAMFGSVIVKR